MGAPLPLCFVFIHCKIPPPYISLGKAGLSPHHDATLGASGPMRACGGNGSGIFHKESGRADPTERASVKAWEKLPAPVKVIYEDWQIRLTQPLRSHTFSLWRESASPRPYLKN